MQQCRETNCGQISAPQISAIQPDRRVTNMANIEIIRPTKQVLEFPDGTWGGSLNDIRADFFTSDFTGGFAKQHTNVNVPPTNYNRGLPVGLQPMNGPPMKCADGFPGQMTDTITPTNYADGFVRAPARDIKVTTSTAIPDFFDSATYEETQWSWPKVETRPIFSNYSGLNDLPLPNSYQYDVEITDQLCEIIPNDTVEDMHSQPTTYPTRQLVNRTTNRHDAEDLRANRLVTISRDIQGKTNTIMSEKLFRTKPITRVIINNMKPFIPQQKIYKQRYCQRNQTCEIKLEDRMRWEEKLTNFVQQQSNKMEKTVTIARETTSRILQNGMNINGMQFNLKPDQCDKYYNNGGVCVDENDMKIIVDEAKTQAVKNVDFEDLQLPVICANELKQCVNKMSENNNGVMYVFVPDKSGNLQKRPFHKTTMVEPGIKMVYPNERKEKKMYGTHIDVEKRGRMKRKSFQFRTIGTENVTKHFYPNEILRQKENINVNGFLPFGIRNAVNRGGNLPINKIMSHGMIQNIHFDERKKDNKASNTAIIFDPEMCGKLPQTDKEGIKVVYLNEHGRKERLDNCTQLLHGMDKPCHISNEAVPAPHQQNWNADDPQAIYKVAEDSDMLQKTVQSSEYQRPMIAEDFNMDEDILRADPELRVELNSFQRNLRTSMLD